MKKVLLLAVVPFVFMFGGCSVEKKAQDNLEKANVQLQAGKEEGLKTLADVAKDYPSTVAGQKAAQIIAQVASARARGNEVSARSDLSNLNTIFQMCFSEKSHYPRNVEEFNKTIEQPAPQGDLAKYQQVPKPHITDKQVKAIAIVSPDGVTYNLCTYNVNGLKAYCNDSSGNHLEVDRSKGVIEDLMAKGTPNGEIEGLTFFVKK